MCARFGRSRRCAVSITYKYSMQRFAVYQRHIQCPRLSRLKVCSDTEYIKQPCFFDVYLTCLFFSFQIVNREKRRYLERTGRFYAFTFGISQKSDVLIY